MKRNHIAVIGCMMLAALAVSGCQDAVTQEEGQESVQQQTVQQEYASPDGKADDEGWGVADPYRFLREAGVQMFQYFLEPGENTLVSPLSILGSLGMTACGAGGETEAQTVCVFGGSQSSRALTIYYGDYVRELSQGDKYELALANSLWLRDVPDLDVNEVFADSCSDYYHAEVRRVPLDGSAAEEINRWADENTGGMIPVISDDIPESAGMCLVSVLAFDAEWASGYGENEVREGIFTASDGRRQSAEMMYSEEQRYLQGDGAAGFIKYYADEKYAFIALLPDEGTGVSKYVSELAQEPGALTELLENAAEERVSVAIPKFQCSYCSELQDDLKAMGMEKAFNAEEADFSFISSSARLYIDKVLHGTYIAVDERGTGTGAAAPGAEDAEASEDIRTVYLDRPFLYMIIDCEENVPLFIGTLDHLE